MIIKRLSLFFLLIFIFSFAYAADYGAFIQGEFDSKGAEEANAKGSIVIVPWLSASFGKSQLYVSGGLNTSIAKESYFAPELFRLEFSSQVPLGNEQTASMFSFRVGRFNWQDASGFIAKGRFDGAELLLKLDTIRLGVNVLYTGFLFKDTAEINVSPADTKDYKVNLDWANFGNTYFAPRRLLASLYGEFPGFPPGRG